mgnify:CR=1 FL=1
MPQNCPSFPDVHFPAIKPESGMSEIGTGVPANLDAKQMLYSSSEFFGALDFLVTFLAMKKVTRIPSCNEIISRNDL